MTECYSRRRFVATTGVVGVAALAGCSGGGGGGDGDGGGTVVEAGPDGQLVFDPESVTVSTGTTVTWEFPSPGHNVCAYPEMHEKVSIPDGADGFGSMEAGGDRFATVEQGGTYEHTFETTGEFTYVCVPHASADMVGTVVVE